VKIGFFGSCFQNVDKIYQITEKFVDFINILKKLSGKNAIFFFPHHFHFIFHPSQHEILDPPLVEVALSADPPGSLGTEL